eukprot:COSAG06_NODE_8639_length_2108_cov_2.107516_2_plen_94_part_00
MQSQGTFSTCAGWSAQQLTALPPPGPWRTVLALALALLLLLLALPVVLLVALLCSARVIRKQGLSIAHRLIGACKGACSSSSHCSSSRRQTMI